MARQINGEMERRAMLFEVKSLDKGEFEGYGSVFGVRDSYGDAIMAGAFAKTLERFRVLKRMPSMLWQHDWRQPIGVWAEVREDSVGLYVRGRTVDTTVGRDAYELIKTGALDGLSIGFVTKAAEWPDGEEDWNSPRNITELDLWEVSPVTFPANDAARITDVRAAASWTERELEALLVRSGLSRRQARGLVAAGWRGFLRDADPSSGHEGLRDAASVADLADLRRRLTSLE